MHARGKNFENQGVTSVVNSLIKNILYRANYFRGYMILYIS